MIKALPKILTIFFFTVFILQIFSIAILLTAPPTALAGDAKFTPQVPIPGINYDSLMSEKSTKPIGEYVKAIYKYLIGIVGIIAVVVMMFGGLRWITAAGSAEGISEAKAWIGASLTGLVLVLGSYMILKTVNPDLVNLKTSPVKTVEAPPKNALTWTEIEKKCIEECKSGSFQYDPRSNLCNCYGKGTHKECQITYGTYGSRTENCIVVPFPGTNTCTDDQSCMRKYGCCRCLWGTGISTYLYASVYTSCTASVSIKTQEDCNNYCGFYPNKDFVPGAICDKDKNCVAQ